MCSGKREKEGVKHMCVFHTEVVGNRNTRAYLLRLLVPIEITLFFFF